MSIRVCAGYVVDLDAAHQFTKSHYDPLMLVEDDYDEDPFAEADMGTIWSGYMSWRRSLPKEDRPTELIRKCSRTPTSTVLLLTTSSSEYGGEDTLFLPTRIVRVPASAVDTVQESDSDRIALKDALLKLNSHVDKQLAFNESHMQFRAVPCSKLIPRPFTSDNPLPIHY